MLIQKTLPIVPLKTCLQDLVTSNSWDSELSLYPESFSGFRNKLRNKTKYTEENDIFWENLIRQEDIDMNRKLMKKSPESIKFGLELYEDTWPIMEYINNACGSITQFHTRDMSEIEMKKRNEVPLLLIDDEGGIYRPEEEEPNEERYRIKRLKSQKEDRRTLLRYLLTFDIASRDLGIHMLSVARAASIAWEQHLPAYPGDFSIGKNEKFLTADGAYVMRSDENGNAILPRLEGKNAGKEVVNFLSFGESKVAKYQTLDRVLWEDIRNFIRLCKKWKINLRELDVTKFDSSKLPKLIDSLFRPDDEAIERLHASIGLRIDNLKIGSYDKRTSEGNDRSVEYLAKIHNFANYIGKRISDSKIFKDITNKSPEMVNRVLTLLLAISPYRLGLKYSEDFINEANKSRAALHRIREKNGILTLPNGEPLILNTQGLFAYDAYEALIHSKGYIILVDQNLVNTPNARTVEITPEVEKALQQVAIKLLSGNTLSARASINVKTEAV